MTDSEFDRRKELSFLQAEGLAPLPTMLKGPVVTPKFKAKFHQLLMTYLWPDSNFGDDGPSLVAKKMWVDYFCGYLDQMPTYNHLLRDKLRSYAGNDAQLLDLVEYSVRERIFKPTHFDLLNLWLREERIGYRFFGGYGSMDITLVPISDEEESDQNQANYLQISTFKGASKHFMQSAHEVSEGHFRGSVTESISGVESVLKSVTGEKAASLGTALNILGKQKALNPLLKVALEKLYAWTNGPDGMRHALTDEAEEITENEALFMLSSCLAFAAWIKREALSA